MNVLSVVGGFVKDNAPTILKVAGVVLTAGAVGLAAYGGTKFVEDVEYVDESRQINDAVVAANTAATEEESEMALAIAEHQLRVYLLKAILKRFGIPALMYICGTISYFGAFNIVAARNAAVVATLATALEVAEVEFDRYRSNVVSLEGPEADEMYLKGYVKTGESELVAAKDDEHPECEMVVCVEEIDTKGLEVSPHARMFDEYNIHYVNNAEYNMFYLKTQEAYANTRLHMDGVLFLNDVYDLLGYERTKAGQVLGWRDKGGHGYVDFGMFTENNERFVEGSEPAVLLDFNIDGIVTDALD